MGSTQSSETPYESSLEKWISLKEKFEDQFSNMDPHKQRETFYRNTGSTGEKILKKLYLEGSRNEITVRTLIFKFDVYFLYRRIARGQGQSIDDYFRELRGKISGFGSHSAETVMKEKVLQDIVSHGFVAQLRELNIEESSLSMLRDVWKDAEDIGGNRQAPPTINNPPNLSAESNSKNEGGVKGLQNINKYYNHVRQIRISENSVGNSYQSRFGFYMKKEVTWIQIDEPYLIKFYQLQNFLRFCELARKKCPSLSYISLTTKRDSSGISDQTKSLDELTKTLADHGIKLLILYSDTLHDRKIELSTGCVIQLGRGLHYFKHQDGQFYLGYNDLDLRPCYKTSIVIFQKNSKRG